MITKTQKNIIITILFIALIAVIILVYSKFSVGNNERVDLIFAPKDSVVKIDGKNVSGGLTYLKPGNYKYVISREHFNDFTGELKVEKGNKNGLNHIIAELSPSDGLGTKIVKKNMNDFYDVEEYSNDASTKAGEIFRDQNPIVKLLPYSNMLYTIGYKQDLNDDSNQSIILTIHSDPVYYNSAIKQLSNWGYNPVDYKINFTGEENPF